ncbi:MAG: hypothetical protein HWE21_03910 [Cytophagia bacterium]|nr:hypothetical protein [Cytophagia bacterium]
MTQGKLSRYLVYAIGEILLVVLGILIALKINNWNETVKNKKQEVVLLKNLKYDFEQNMQRLQSGESYISQRRDYIDQLLGYLRHLPEKIDSAETVALLERISMVHNFHPAMPTYQEMQGSGTLNLIKSIPLKNAIANYQTVLNSNEKIEISHTPAFMEYARRIANYMDEGIGEVNLTSDDYSAYNGINFDLEAMSKDEILINLLKDLRNKTTTELRYKDELLMTRMANIMTIINGQLKVSEDHLN